MPGATADSDWASLSIKRTASTWRDELMRGVDRADAATAGPSRYPPGGAAPGTTGDGLGGALANGAAATTPAGGAAGGRGGGFLLTTSRNIHVDPVVGPSPRSREQINSLLRRAQNARQ